MSTGAVLAAGCGDEVETGTGGNGATTSATSTTGGNGSTTSGSTTTTSTDAATTGASMGGAGGTGGAGGMGGEGIAPAYGVPATGVGGGSN